MEQEILSAGSVDLVIRTLEFALAGCARRDAERVTRSLTLLEQSIDPRPLPDLGRSLAGIYGYCRTLLDFGAFDEAASYLRGLRDAWVKVKAKT